ncbi:MAG TPA: oligosaccharide flippase family protein [Solirubrobacteraceae bacterium]|nr:oligosaccharide flippase family protein [Solirubrobacteraceae bacterium]
MSTAVKLAHRLGRDTGVFAAGTAVTLVLAFVQVAVVTRYLSPAEFGELAVYYVFATMLTIVYGLGSLQGTLLRVFGSAGEEEVDDESHTGGGSRRALTSGLLLTIALVSAGTVAIAVAADPIARVLLGRDGDAGAVVVAAAAGATGALWRLVSNVQRFAARPISFAVLSNVRPVAIVALTAAVLAAGGGVRDVLHATVGGTAVALVVGLAVTARNYELSASLHDVRPILRAGAVYVPLILSVWIVQNADVYILSRFVDTAEVGVYRVANRVSSVVAYAVSAFLLAWVPVSRTSLFDAARAERGDVGLGRLLVTYYVFAAAGLMVALASGADALAGVAPRAYREAAHLIPVVGFGFVAYGLFVVVYRAARFEARRRRYFQLAVVAAAVLLSTGPPLAAAFGTYGIAGAVMLAFGVATAGMLLLSERGPTPMGLPWPRLAAAVALAAAAYGVARGLAAAVPDDADALELLAVVLYPALLVVTGVVPRTHARALVAVAASLASGRRTRTEVVERVAALPAADRELLRRVVVDGERGGGAEREAAQALRRLVGIGDADHDADIGRYLLSHDAHAEREARRRELRRDGVDPLELHELEEAVALLRRLPARAWAGDAR